MTTLQISTQDFQTLIRHARNGADDVTNQVIDEIVTRATAESEAARLGYADADAYLSAPGR